MGASGGLLTGLAKFGQGFMTGRKMRKDEDRQDEESKLRRERQERLDAIQELRERRLLERGSSSKASAAKDKLYEAQAKILEKRLEKGLLSGPQSRELSPEERTLRGKQADYWDAKAKGLLNPQARPTRVLTPEEIDLKKAQAEKIRSGIGQTRPQRVLDDSQKELNYARAESLRNPKPRPTLAPKVLDESVADLNRARAESLRNPKPRPTNAPRVIDESVADLNRAKAESLRAGKPTRQLSPEELDLKRAQAEKLRSVPSQKPGALPKPTPNPLSSDKRFIPRVKDGLQMKSESGDLLFDPAPSPTPKPVPTPKPIDPLDRKLKEARLKQITTPKSKGKGVGQPKLTEGMWKANSFGKRALQGESEITALEATNKPPKANEIALWRKAPSTGLLSYGTDLAMPANIKKQLAAEQLFLNAILRNDSGASTPEAEYPRYESQFFVRAGDPPQVIEQKRRARKLAIEQLRAEAGPTWEKTNIQSIPGEPSQPSNKVGTIKAGKGGKKYRFKGGSWNDKNSWELVK